MAEIRLSEARDLFGRELSFPVSRETVVSEIGDVHLQAPGSGGESISSVLARCETEEFRSSDELVSSLMTFVDDDFVGRKGYDDRGRNPGYDDEVSL